MRRIVIAAFAAVALLSTTVAVAEARCRISNRTKYSFTVKSGNTSNQRVGANTTTSIASGKIIGKSDKSGKSFGGSCKDGDTLELKEESGVVVLIHK